ncbi:MAG: outer membrane beta-barrel protein [Candidatus Omnitrophica bacterium]|nr:outer membrane beta-barrel protein [Candidatus Omnitrophota bacterium]
MKGLAIGLFTAVFLFNAFSFAQEPTERKEDKYDYLKALTYVETITQPVKNQLRENDIDLNFFLGLLQGFDGNVYLESSGKEQGAFFEASLNTEAVYNYTDDIRLKLTNDTSNVLYYWNSDATLLDTYNEAEMEMDLFGDMFTLGALYAFELVWFPGDKDGTYLANQAGTFLRYNFNDNIYHEIGYKFLHKNFSHYKTLNPDKVRTDELRVDNRNIAYYEAGVYLFDRLMVRTNIEIYGNNSNYDYFHYYDYFSFKVRPSAIIMLTDKLYASGSFAYQQKRYDDRLSSETNEHVYDDIYTVNGSLFYDLTKSFTVAVNCSYSENVSNEPLQEYTAGTITAGLYYSF